MANVAAYIDRGRTYIQQNDNDRAIADFTKAIQLDPEGANVKVRIDEEGKVIAANAISGHPLLWDACVEAAKNSLFSPTLFADKPVKVDGVIQYNFVQR